MDLFIPWAVIGIIGWIILTCFYLDEVTLADIFMIVLCAICGPMTLLFALLLVGKKVVLWKNR